MKINLKLTVIALVSAAAAMPAAGSDISADVLWNQGPARTGSQPASTDAYRPQTLIGYPHPHSVPGVTGANRPVPAPCHCAMKDHAHR